MFTLEARHLVTSLALLDSTLVLEKTRIQPGLWARENRLVFLLQVLLLQLCLLLLLQDRAEVEIVLDHTYAGSHPNLVVMVKVGVLT